MSSVRPPIWYDAQYDARASIADQASIRQAWVERCQKTRASLPCRLDQAYGVHASERLDILGHRPACAGAPVLIYIHGGYWRALDKRDQSFVALPFVAAGAVVVVPNYALAPAVTVRHIVLQMLQAVAWVYRNIGPYGGDPQRLVVAGHSAGGHLATMMLAAQWPQLDADLPSNTVKAALSVSGIYDLAPLRHAPFLASDLKLTAIEAKALSPAFMPAPKQGRLISVAGADESAEFQRQNTLIRQAWGAQAVPVCETLPGRHHMNVLHDLAQPGQRLHTLALGLLGLG